MNKEQETLVIEFVENYRQRLSYNQISKKKAEKSCKSQSEICLEKLFAVRLHCRNGRRQNRTFDKLWNALQNPYEEIYPEFSVKRPEKI